jgi:hypothetical protein
MMGDGIRAMSAPEADRLWTRLYKEVGRTGFLLVLREYRGTNAIARQLIGRLPADRVVRGYARLHRTGYFRAEGAGSYAVSGKGQQFLKDVEAADDLEVTEVSPPWTTATH